MFNRSIAAVALAVAGLVLQSADACTEVVLNKTPGLVISGRTLDYNSELGSKICFREKGAKIEDPGVKWTQIKDQPLSWTAKYSAVLVDAFDEQAFVDGMNTEGLTAACLWQADTQLPESTNPGTTALSNVALVEYIVENAKDVEEAKKLISGLSLYLSTYKGQPMVLHWIINDRSGKSVVVELKDGRPKFFDDVVKVGVMANQPSYDKQLSNLKTQEAEQAKNPSAYTLPGDYQSCSRFVKSAYLVSHLPEITNAEQGVNSAMQILHNVESPKGAQSTGSYTQWIVVRDQSNLRYWLTSVNHPSPKLVDLKTIDFKTVAGKRVPVDSANAGDVAKMPELTAQQATVSQPSSN